jgi:hypothetical protein
LGGEPTFAETKVSGEIAPEAVIPRYRSLNGSVISRTWLHVLRFRPNTAKDPAYLGKPIRSFKTGGASDGYTSGR